MVNVLARGIAALALLAAFTAARPALAGDPASTPFTASFDSGGTIVFELLEEAGKRDVGGIEISEIRAQCEGRRAKLNFAIFGTTPVREDRSFAVRSEDSSGKGKAVVRGRFSRNYTRAKGTARVFGKFSLENVEGRRVGCESEKQPYEATSQP